MKVKNSFWQPDGSGSGPEFYQYRQAPIQYKGALIFCVVPTRLKNGRPWAGQYDVVIDGICMDQRVTMDFAKKAADEFLGDEA